ncbi:anthrone oxygenase family protein [Halioglobus pacificus]|uniref:anthrone oxygenase family protein n=1 Tax=Parahalioglobus pacificus TaxID=930806 RepID=UPI00357163CA
MLLAASCLVYLFGVQLPTFIINIPLNNHLQSCDLDAMSDAELMEMTAMFDSRWLKWNAIRTVLAALTTTLLLILLTRL